MRIRCVLVTTGALAVAVFATGCQSQSPNKSGPAAQSQPSTTKDRHADAMTQSDTDRAKAAMQENEDAGQPQRPAAPPAPAGSSVVNQPVRRGGGGRP